MSLVGLCVQAEALRIEREAAAEEHRIAERSWAALLCVRAVLEECMLASARIDTALFDARSHPL